MFMQSRTTQQYFLPLGQSLWLIFSGIHSDLSVEQDETGKQSAQGGKQLFVIGHQECRCGQPD